MPTRVKKIEILSSLEEKFKVPFIIFLNFSKLNVKQQTQIRKKFKKIDAEFFVGKNRLIRKAVENVGLKDLKPYLQGQTAIVRSGNFQDTAKILTELSVDFETLNLKIGVFEGKLIKPERIKELSNLPPREVLVKQICLLLNMPLNRLINTLQNPINKLVLTLNAIKDKK